MKLSLLGVGLLALSTTIGFAQAAPVVKQQTAVAQHHMTINQRRANQQRRIAKGIRTGRIHAVQGARLERKQARVARTEHRMRRANGGRLTRAQHVRLNHRLNRTGRAIRRANQGARKQ